MRNSSQRVSPLGERPGLPAAFLLLAAISLLVIQPGPAYSGTPVARPMQGLAMTRAMNALSASQRDFEQSRASWSWQRGQTKAAPNTGGVIALSLIEAHQATGSGDALRAARSWGDARLADLSGWRSIFDPDVEALARLTEVTGDGRYLAAARDAFDRRWEGASGEEIVGRLIMVRRRLPTIVGYDAALVVRAAVAVGRIEIAGEVAAETLRLRASWDPAVRGEDVDGLSTTSMAALLGAIEAMGGKGTLDAGATEELLLRLVAAQEPSGSWALRNTQTTAYAVRALFSIDSPLALHAARRGARWLESTQLADGHWASFHDGLPEPFVGEVMNEVTAEVLLALVAAGR